MVKKTPKTTQHCIVSGRPIRTFGGKNDRGKSGIHTEFGAVHRDSYQECENLRKDIGNCLRSELGVKPFMPIPKRASRMVSKIGKFCIKEHIKAEEAIVYFRDELLGIK